MEFLKYRVFSAVPCCKREILLSYHLSPIATFVRHADSCSKPSTDYCIRRFQLTQDTNLPSNSVGCQMTGSELFRIIWMVCRHQPDFSIADVASSVRCGCRKLLPCFGHRNLIPGLFCKLLTFWWRWRWRWRWRNLW